MKRIATAFILAFAALLIAPPASARECVALDPSCPTPPATAYTFGEAKPHAHGEAYRLTGFFCGKGLVYDATNNGGNHFFGNTVCVATLNGAERFWYDWSTDPQAGEKMWRWFNAYPFQLITVEVADADCKLATAAFDPLARAAARIRVQTPIKRPNAARPPAPAARTPRRAPR